MARYSCEAAVVGAGAVGLAVARQLARAGRETLILERHPAIGMETSARNSEVIHAGLYYPSGSLKARLCVSGRRLLYAFCQSHGVAHRRLGKLIVATHKDQHARLAALSARSAANGVDDLQPLSQTQIAALEPEVRACEGLLSPSSGIVDSHQYMLALMGDAEAAGATLVRGARVGAVRRESGGYAIDLADAEGASVLVTAILVNSAGLWAQELAAGIEGLDARFVPPLMPAKGSYAALQGANPFRHLIYPLPEPGGLGVHLSLDMAGGARFGPDVEWLAPRSPQAGDYTVAPDIGRRFAPRIASWWPGVAADRLAPGYCGIRPKLAGPGQPDADFRIDGPGFHGLPGLVNLFGIESPGLTASLAIAAHVEALLS